jgi:hypothetical protein
VANYYPALVTEAEWLQAQAAMQGRKKRTGRPGEAEDSLFTGIVFDTRSGARMGVQTTIIRRQGREYRYRYLHDYRRPEEGKGVRYEPFEGGVLRALSELRPRDELPPRPKEEAHERKIVELTERLVALDHREQIIQQQIADPEQDPAIVPALVASLRQVTANKAATGKELQALKLESVTGRGETLGEVRSLLELLADATKEEAGQLRLRIKARLRWLVESIWLLPQVVTSHCVILHVQIYLRGGTRKYLQIIPQVLRELEPWELSGADFRAGYGRKVSDVAADSEATPELVG